MINAACLLPVPFELNFKANVAQIVAQGLAFQDIHVGLEHSNVVKRGPAKYVAFLAQYYSLAYSCWLSSQTGIFLARNALLNEGKPISYKQVDWADTEDDLGLFDLITRPD